jgi:putative acetyltransferase
VILLLRPKWNLLPVRMKFLLLRTHCKLNRTVMHTSGKVVLAEARSPAEIAAVRELSVEYAIWIGFSLAYQDFDHELASLPGKYAGPTGRLLLARVDEAPAGCGAIRQLETSVCEMKRLFVKPEFRGCGLGRTLAEKLIGHARGMGYSAMRLDTVAEKMGDAVRLYKKLGFHEIPAYYSGAQAGTLYFELRLT